ncbi:MAG: outer membrane lipoprotein chaperone LolA [Gammaproteobacteria bacterium]
MEIFLSKGKIVLSPFFLCVLCVLCAKQSFASPETDALQRFVGKVETLTADFQQVQKDERGKVLSTSSGRLWLSRPGKFKWSYEKPYQQLIVCDAKELWTFDPDLDQAMVRPAGATLQGTPAQLLTDRAALDAHFKVEGAGSDGGALRLRLLPKAADSDFKLIEMWFVDSVPVRMRFHDPLGGISEVEFTGIKTNVALDAGLFRFTPPKGTEVIRAEGPAGP